MSTQRVNVSLPSELFDRIEAARGDVSRSRWIKRALESALNGQGSGNTPAVSSPRGSGSAKETAPTEPSASARAPVIPEDVDAFSQGETPSRADRFRNARKS